MVATDTVTKPPNFKNLIFKSGDPETRAKAIVEATTHFDDAKVLADVSAGLGEPMVGISSSTLADDERLEVRGW